jgi:hypothetical protein
VAGVIRNTLMLWSPLFDTKRRLLVPFTVIRSMRRRPPYPRCHPC